MELPEIEKAIKEFEAKLKPIKEGQTTLTQEEVEAAGPPPWEEKALPKLVPEPGEFCLTGAFKQLVVALEEAYIGNNAKLWLLQQPDCAEVG